MEVRRNHVLLLLLAATLVAALYWPGLYGPFVLDDDWNLRGIKRWLAGAQGWELTLSPSSSSLLLSRPVAMGSFMLSAWLGGGVEPFPFKLGNLIIHVLCGFAGWWLLRRLLKLDPNTSARADAWALAAAAIWLLHPMHVSTVLYAVQRMAQLATLFTLLAVIAYLVGRIQLESGRRQAALANLFVAFPAFLLLGMFSKQNAVIAGFICLVIELAYFTRQPAARRPVALFFGLFAGLPALAAIAILTLAPERLLAGYADWDFTLGERLLTQPRALVDYIGMWFVPRGPEMGLYTDAYPISQSLLSPATTLPAILAIAGVSIAAVACRKRWPLVFVGWFFFLVAHAVESSFLPLEMYYEHRNYLPSMGLLLAAIGVIDAVARRAGQHDILGQRLTLPLVLIIAATLAFSTFARSNVWQDESLMISQGLRSHPDSLRVKLDSLSLALRSGDLHGAQAITDRMAESKHARHRLVGEMDSVAIRCLAGKSPSPTELVAAAQKGLPELTVHELHVAMLQEQIVNKSPCNTISAEQMADSLVELLDRSTAQPFTTQTKATILRIAVHMYSTAGAWEKAQANAERAWPARKDVPLGILLTQAYVMNGQLDLAEESLSTLRAIVRPVETERLANIASLQQLLTNARAAGTASE